MPMLLLCSCFCRTRRKEEPGGISQTPSTEKRTWGSSFRVGVPSADRTPPGTSLHGGGSGGSGIGTPRFQFLKSPELRTKRSTDDALFSFDQIVKMTQNFSPMHKIGEEGFGSVYKAQVEDGRVVAVKRQERSILQLSEQKEFKNEVEMLSKINHRNLVKIIGCIEETEMIVITEYVPNGNLREHLDGKRGAFLKFSQRLEIVIDVAAHALTYLHTTDKPIIHRDVKSSNILLTESFRAKVTDFRIAKLGATSGKTNSHILTKVKGTVGYLDPEYVNTYKLTDKSDVYSFGILLLEIISGRRPVEMKKPMDEKITVRWAFENFNKGHVGEILDPKIGEAVNGDIVRKMLHLAFHCVSPIRKERPMMKIIAEKLWEIRKDYRKV